VSGELETTRFDVDGAAARVSVRRAAARAPTVLLLHGYPDTLRVFTRVVAALEASWGYVAIDFPGQGGSPGAPSSPVTPRDRATWLTALLDGLDVAQVRVFGHDMGAHAALELALTRPDRVERVVVANALLDGTAPCSRTITLLRWSALYRVLLPTFPGRVAAQCIRDFLPRTNPLTPRVRADIVASFTRAAARTTSHVCDAAEGWLAQGLDRFRELPMPVTALWGEAEHHFPRAHATALRQAVPHATLSEIPGGHHWLAWHAPARVVESLGD
jgi:pimeloyl-ACP methyl ester carboxylesterase